MRRDNLARKQPLSSRAVTIDRDQRLVLMDEATFDRLYRLARRITMDDRVFDSIDGDMITIIHM